VKGGVMSPDEGRAKFNLGPVPGGNTPYLQQQNYSLAALAKRDAQEDPFRTAPAPASAPVAPPPAPAESEKHFDVLAFVKALDRAELVTI
jgi:phage portal protein BeeE